MDILKIFSSIKDPEDLAEFYFEHELDISQKLFFNKYFKLVGRSTEECFSSIADWYADVIVLLILQKEEISDPVIKSQKVLEERFIERNLMENCILLDVGCGPGRIPPRFTVTQRLKKFLLLRSQMLC